MRNKILLIFALGVTFSPAAFAISAGQETKAQTSAEAVACSFQQDKPEMSVADQKQSKTETGTASSAQ